MKRILSIVLVSLFVVGTALAAVPGNYRSPGHGDKLGQGGLPSQPGKIFRLVRYEPAAGTQDSATLPAESIVIWDTNSDDGVTVTTTTTSYDSAVAGIIKWNALTADPLGQTAVKDLGDRNWTWLQTYGLAQVRVQGDAAPIVVKEAMACGSDAGEAVDFISNTTNGALLGQCGFFMDAAAAAADNVDCFLQID